ncbi:hypothetical protein B0H17DRAFT_1330855 [Mycena rosella]|uniref:Uncharacterized protein n=1 Tax=Mycena rosella TaxID=1033263 RepID=A0AAD7DIB9_MYCRO|nr:hypothetical protein B0H17DRAFT_1330855 [Mycena rosella]
MATIVDRPLSAFTMPDPPSVIPQRRQRDSVEVIDVDSFEDAAPRPSQKRRVELPLDVIELLDSDDEQSAAPAASGSGSSENNGVRRFSFRSPAVASGSGSGSGSTSAHASRRPGSSTGGVAGTSSQGRRRMFSPPPPVSFSGTIPPVPPLPARYSSYRSFTQALQQPHPAPDSSLSAPLFVRAAVFATPEPTPAAAAPELRPAPPARHNPPMGLGGALISSNNARLAAERLERQRRGERRAAGGRYAPAIASTLASGSGGSSSRARSPAPRSSFMRRLANLNPLRWGGNDTHTDIDLLALSRRRTGADGDERTRGDAQLALDLYLRDQDDVMRTQWAHPARGFARREIALLRGWAGGAPKDEEAYRAEWTHPGAPEAGYVWDFAPSESEIVVPKGKGKGKEVAIDVDAERENVCTLLVCAKCLDPLLMRADGITEGGEEEVRRRKVWGLRCGHMIDGKCYEALRKPEEEGKPDTLDAPAVAEPTGKGNGKGKAKAREVEDDDEDFDELFDEEEEEDLVPNPIRSRLRPRTLGMDPSAPAPAPSAFEITVPLPRARPRKTKRKGKGKGKGKGKMRKPVVEAKHEWTCPVAGCGRVHVSEKVDGVWGNGADRGAVALFV